MENVAALLSGPPEQPGRWFGRVLGDLAEIGYDAEWNSITAASVGAEHERDRVWIVAYPNEAQLERGSLSRRIHQEHTNIGNTRWGKDKPGVVRTLNGIPNQMDRVGALGNAVVPQIPEIIGRAIMRVEGMIQ
jgi:DNA (cytosine-5)-methyltransferase 1